MREKFSAILWTPVFLLLFAGLGSVFVTKNRNAQDMFVLTAAILLCLDEYVRYVLSRPKSLSLSSPGTEPKQKSWLTPLVGVGLVFYIAGGFIFTSNIRISTAIVMIALCFFALNRYTMGKSQN